MMLDRIDSRYACESKTSPERYMLLNENEKDLEIQKAVLRINKRIQEILYLIETDKR